MGRFQCVQCSRPYYDKRFIWEPEEDEEDQAGAEAAWEDSMLTTTSGKAVDPTFSSEDCCWLEEDSDKGKDAAGSSRDREHCMVGFPGASVAQAKVLADTVRATGTAANITGSLVQAAGAVCAPISSVAGVVGAVGGATQLYRGLYTPSNIVDPHLVTKGGITTGVGSTCMVMGACAGFAPVLFVAALGLGVTGLSAATVVDALMCGLCPECREQEPEQDDAEKDETQTDLPSTSSMASSSSPEEEVAGDLDAMATTSSGAGDVAGIRPGNLDWCFPCRVGDQLHAPDPLACLVQQVRQQKRLASLAAKKVEEVVATNNKQTIALEHLPCLLDLVSSSSEDPQCLTTQALYPLLSNLFLLRDAGALEGTLRDISTVFDAGSLDIWSLVVARVRKAVMVHRAVGLLEPCGKTGLSRQHSLASAATTAASASAFNIDSAEEDEEDGGHEDWELEFLLRGAVSDLWGHLEDGKIRQGARAVDAAWALVAECCAPEA